MRSLAGFPPTKQPLGAVSSGQGMKEGERLHFKKPQTPTAEKPSPICTGASGRNSASPAQPGHCDPKQRETAAAKTVQSLVTCPIGWNGDRGWCGQREECVLSLSLRTGPRRKKKNNKTQNSHWLLLRKLHSHPPLQPHSRGPDARWVVLNLTAQGLAQGAVSILASRQLKWECGGKGRWASSHPHVSNVIPVG